MLSEPVAMIAPGQEMRTFYDSHVERNGRSDLPSLHRIALRYQDTSGHHYDESGVLDLDAMKGTMFTELKTVHDIGKSLAEIQKTLKSASIMSPRGPLEVEASVEPHHEKQERLVRERTELEEQHNKITRMLIADGGAG